MRPSPVISTTTTQRVRNEVLHGENLAPSSTFELPEYHGVGNLYLINSKKLQIGIGIGKFSIINSEELHIGKLLGTEP